MEMQIAKKIETTCINNNTTKYKNTEV